MSREAATTATLLITAREALEKFVEVRVDAAARWLDVTNAIGAAPRPADEPGALPRLGLGLGHRVVEKVVALHGAAFAELPAGAAARRYRITFGAET